MNENPAMRGAVTLVSLATMLLAPVGARATDPVPEWEGTRWSEEKLCDREVMTLAPNSLLIIDGLVEGAWHAIGSDTVEVERARDGNKPIRMKRDGRFGLFGGNDVTAEPLWEQCDASFNRPSLPNAYISGEVWSGFRDCRVSFRFNVDGTLTLSTGQRGHWALENSLLEMAVDGDAQPLRLSRSGGLLIEAESGGAFMPCESK